MAEKKNGRKNGKRQPKPEKVFLASIHSVNSRYKSLVAICDDMRDIDKTRAKGRAPSKKLLATSELGWKTQIRKILVEPFHMDEALRFNDGKKLGSFMGKISGIYEIPYELYDYHRKEVYFDMMTKEYKEASVGISDELAKSVDLAPYTIPLVGGLEIRAEAPRKIEGGDIEGNMTTVAGNKNNQVTVAGLFLRCLKVGGGVRAVNDVLSMVRKQAMISRENNDLAAHATFQTILRRFYEKIDRVYGSDIKELSPVRIAYS